MTEDLDEAYVADKLITEGIGSAALDEAMTSVADKDTVPNWVAVAWKRLTCSHPRWIINYPIIKRDLNDSGAPGRIFHGPRVIIEDRFAGSPVAELECANCGKLKHMLEDEFWEIVGELRRSRAEGQRHRFSFLDATGTV